MYTSLPLLIFAVLTIRNVMNNDTAFAKNFGVIYNNRSSNMHTKIMLRLSSLKFVFLLSSSVANPIVRLKNLTKSMKNLERTCNRNQDQHPISEKGEIFYSYLISCDFLNVLV